MARESASLAIDDAAATGDEPRREHGSFLELSAEVGTSAYPWPDDASLWASGRDAMRALLAHGRDHLGWRRLLCPSYMCQVVAGSLVSEIALVPYPIGPTTQGRPVLETVPGDVVLAIASFGIRLEPTVIGPAPVIADHTHDPWSEWATEGRAEYAVASLRKTLPLPDGGVIWSPRGLEYPAEVPMTDAHGRSTFERLEAMSLKTSYLEGAAISKDAFRSLYAAGEAEVARGEVSGISPYARARLRTFPTAAWRERRLANRDAFRSALGEVPGRVLESATFAAIIVFDEPARREAVRRRLIDERVYPVVYWPLEHPVVRGIDDGAIELSRRILAIPCDQRYDETAMEHVAQIVRAAAAAP